MAIAAVLLIVPMLGFVRLIQNEKGAGADPAFLKSIGPEKEISTPTTKGTKVITFDRNPDGKKVRCTLPGELSTKEAGFAYGYNNAIISVMCEGVGEAGVGVVTRFATTSTQPVRTSNGFKGAYEERYLPGTKRRDRMYYLGSPKFSYSMMIAWPEGDSAALKDAELLASMVAYSVELVP